MEDTTSSVNRLDKSFVKDLNESNRPRDPFMNQFRLMDTSGAPIINSKLERFQHPLVQKKFLGDVVKDISDSDPSVVDLDTAITNEAYLQQAIANRVARENQLSSSGIQLADQIKK